ncbi:hybrid sensor histidine kinase/response regulator [Azospirillum thermophilum]|uniref:histidine kinase n=1 Tax=Azospirillum thermophilum TaxID=2202148 RepID=A0A2S2CWD3_9PROT|nr:PAS domain-containing protein [Azospirillum thermophilum]AWK88791.1 hybrid sensor histidine kinase/response regulator [Azospirillum thermophilum]
MRLRLPVAVLAAALPLIIFAILMIMMVSQQQQQSVEAVLRQATAASLRAVDERVAVTRSALEMLATSRALENLDQPLFADRMARALRQRLDWVALDLRNREGEVLAFAHGDDPSARPLAGEAIRAQLDAVFRFGESRVSGLLATPEPPQEPTIAVSIPVFGDAGVAYALTAHVRAWALNRALRDQGYPMGWIVALLDENQRFLARTLSEGPTDPVLGTLPDPSVFEGLRRGNPFFFSQSRLGDRVYTAAAVSAATGWTVILGAPATVVERVTHRTTLAVLVGGAAALLLTLAISWSLARSHARREAAERRVVALEASSVAERRSAAILESTTDSVIELDPDWRITFMNERARNLIADGRDLTDRVLWEVFPQAVGSEFEEQYRRAMTEKTPVEFEAYYGPLRCWYAVRAFPSPAGLAVYFQDVTEKRRLAEHLTQYQALLDRVMETLPVGVGVIGADGRVLNLNPAARRIWGGIREVGIERYGEYRGWWHGTGEPVAPQDWAAARAVRHGETSLNEIIDIESFDGVRKTIRHSAVPLQYGGTISGAVTVMEDITQQLAAEQRLKDAVDRATDILESIGDAFYAIDQHWRFTYVNRHALELFGMTRDEMVGRDFFEVFPQIRGSEIHARYSQAMADGQMANFESVSPVLRRWVSFSIYPQQGGGLSVYFRDISTQKEAEALLKDSEQRFRTLADSIPQLAWMARPDGAIFWYNRRWYEYTGSTFEEMRGWGWRSVHHPDHIERVVARFQYSLETGEPWEDTFPMRGRNGEWRRFLSRALPVRDERGNIILWFGTNTDVTEQFEVEEALRRAKEEAEQAAQSKSKFLASASHDLRQPMQSLFLFAGALHGHVQGEKGRAALTHLERGLDMLKSLLDSLLDVSRLDAGVVRPTIESFPIDALLDHIAAGYAPVARSKGLEWRMSGCLHVVRSDRVLLGRMIRNLIENAIRYTEAGSVEVACHVAGDRLRVEVGDTGIGIPEDQLSRIFEEFHQIGNQERDRTQGLGLGLAIVQRISRLLDHPVSVRSVPGRGSTFTIEVPLGEAPPPPDRGQDAEAPGASSGERFAVVVDDDPIVLLGLQTILKDWGYTVLIAGSGDQAMEKLRAGNRTPDIIIADYRLREGEVGTDVILAIRGLFGTEIPAIVVTGETGPECQRDAARHGFGLMYKPVTPRQLSSAMDRYLTVDG